MAAVITTTGTIAKGAYVNEWTPVPGGYWVNKYNILGTTMVDYSVWEPFTSSHTDGTHTRSHSTVTYRDDGMALGDITTRDLPADIDALSYGDERIQAVCTWYAANKAEARALVLQVYPEAA